MDTERAQTGHAGRTGEGETRWRRGRRGGAVVLAATVAVALVVAIAAVGVWPGGDAASAAGARSRGAAAALAGAGTVSIPGDGDVGQFQFVPGDQPSLIALGSGEASTPAEGATMQVLVRANDANFGPSMGPQDVPPPPVPAGPVSLTEEQVQPVVDAVVAAGAPAGAVEVVISPPFGGQFGVGSAQVLIELEEGDLDSMLDIARAASEAAPEAGLFLETVNAAYVVADCDPLVREARQDAADDGRERAEGLAEVLGLTLGDLLLVSETPGYAGVPGIGCAADPAVSQFSGKGGGYLPVFDPSLPAEVEIYSQINLAYAIS